MTETGTQDLAAHEQTYARFVQLTKWATASVVALLVLMAMFLLHH